MDGEVLKFELLGLVDQVRGIHHDKVGLLLVTLVIGVS